MTGQTISHYRILEKLGEGGMGVVYKAEDTRLGRIVALKFLTAHLLANEDAKKRFVREARAAAVLDHPNVCTLYEIDEADGRTFMAMAYLDGQTLDAKIAEGPLKLPEAVEIAKQVAKGLQEAHSKGISHRDIKPSNISLLKTSSNELLAKIMDFGLAYLAGQTQFTRNDTILGTTAYMSPEQTQSAGVDHRTDIWALGVVLYEMVSGLRPFRGEYDRAVLYSICNEEPEPLTSLRTGVPMDLEWIAGKALAKHPERRYQSCVELIVDLENIGTKLQSGQSRVAALPLAPSRSFTAPTTRSAPTTRKRQVREMLIGLAAQGILPDRILAEALESISGPGPGESELAQARYRLLDGLAAEQIRVGEFIEQWQQLSPAIGSSGTESPKIDRKSKKKRTVRDVRSDGEILGIPLCHRAWGKDAITGKEKVAAGVLAFGNISVGVIACARWIAIGAVAISPISIGIWAIGVLALGVNAVGPFRLSLSEMPAWQVLLAAAAAALGGGLLLSRLSSRRVDDSLDELVLFGSQRWKSPQTPFRGGRATAYCGSLLIDLSHAEAPAEYAVIDVRAVLGSIAIRVPPNWQVSLDGAPVVGKFEDRRAERPESGNASGPRLLVRGSAIFGSVRLVDGSRATLR